jgi:hypothetical protein
MMDRKGCERSGLCQGTDPVYLQELRKTMKISLDTLPRGRVFNLEPPEYKAGVLLTRLQLPVNGDFWRNNVQECIIESKQKYSLGQRKIQ